MANTQGLSDEALHSLLSTSSRRDALQRRMDMPIGERPAAKVIRSSAQSKARQKHDEDASAAGTAQQEEQPPVVGAVVERKRRTKKNSSSPMLSAPTGGFPSLEKPLGTFARQKNHTARQREAKTDAETTATDADRMLAGMSTAEIQESVQEIEAALSPEMVAFLRKRGQTKAGTAEPNAPKTLEPQPNKDEYEEKLRLAKLMASIQTYEDLDQAVLSQQQGDDSTTAGTEQQQPDMEDWQVASELLRSSSPRQTLWAAKTIMEKLVHDVEVGDNFFQRQWPYPILLPVSLRCLLDASATSPAGVGFVLHTYVLRSLYCLLLLRSYEEYTVDVVGLSSSSTESPRLSPVELYQHWCLDDAVPTIRLSTLFSSESVQTIQSGDASGNAAAYATTSSSTSAQTDGESFAKDPAWTLLSKMRIIPRLAELLQAANRMTTTTTTNVPDEAVVAICGILAMTAQRSCGAASAIVQHKTLLADLFSRTLQPTDTAAFDAHLALPSLKLMCVLARQSRVAAAGLDVSEILLRILSVGCKSESDLRLQQQALVLWRIFLRYGVGLDLVEPIISIATLHVGSKQTDLYSLAPDLFSCFAQIMRCIRVARRGELSERAPGLDREGLLGSESLFLPMLPRAVESICRGSANGDASSLRLLTACIQFINGFCVIMDRDDQAVANAMESIVGSEVLVRAVQMMSTEEADHVACAFVQSVFSLAKSMRNEGYSIPLGLTSIAIDVFSTFRLSIPPASVRAGWHRRANTAVAQFLVSAATDMDSNADVLRAIVFSVLGSLDCGDESRASILLSCDEVFTPRSFTPRPTTSPLSSMLMQELCSSPSARNQMDHSFRLYGGFGITPDGTGPFGLQSLLNEAERVGPKAATDNLLPMGPAWLWQALSGSISIDSTSRALLTEKMNNAIDVIETVLRLIVEIEETESKMMQSFSNSIQTGSKIYHLTNLCLQPDAIIGNEVVAAQACRLVDLYVTRRDDFAGDFMQTCRKHSEARAQYIVDLKESPDSALASAVATNASRSTDEFVADLCEAFLEHGADFPLFAKCVRLFLLPTFPNKVRCNVLRRIQGFLHLLSLEEDDQPSLLSYFVTRGTEGADDALELIDTFASVFSSGSSSRVQKDFATLMGVALLARNLAMAVRRGEASALATSRSRLLRMNRDFTACVVQATSLCLATSGTASDLIHSTIRACEQVREESLRERLLSALATDNLNEVLP